ncbi:MAG: DUF1109 family protein [Sphingomonadales bacterium]|nr:DUF1109 family protein [Sphingomonadales bacterium]MDE2169898.1 DUF1109 family protein [Sphingomonadales bacterium]
MVESATGPAASGEALIEELTGALQPVRRLSPAWLRAAAWGVPAMVMGWFATRIMPIYRPDWSDPQMRWVMVEIVLALMTGAMAMVLAFGSSIAGRRAHGLWLVGMLALVWLAVSAGNIAFSPQHRPHFGAGAYCYSFMLLASAPIMPMVILGLRRTRAVRPGRTLAIAGVGIAFIVAGLLGFCHDGKLHLVDFIMHLVAGATIVLLTTVLGRRFIAL